MIFPANVDNEEEREIMALEGEDKKQSMTTKQILLAFIIIFGNVFISVAFSIIATFFPKTGLNAAAYGLGVSIGPFIGGVLYDLGGFCAPFFVMSGIIGLLFISMFVSFPKLDFKFEKGNSEELLEDDHHFLSMYFTKELYDPLACIISMHMSLGYFDMALGNHAMNTFGFTPTLAGTMFIGYQVVYVISCPIVGRIVDKTHTEKKCMMIGNLILMVVCILIGPAPFLHIPETIWMTEVCLALVAITQAMSYIPSYKVLHRIALEKGFPDNIHTTSKVSGIYLSAMGLGLFGGPSIGGIIIDHYSYGWACTIIGFCCGLSVSGKLCHSLGKYTVHKIWSPDHKR
ncbi:MFS-type transporter SLC18B1 [Nymphon striatum]|nr:MFS-type transporter SLC18B1 [Nymphon striatum]